MPKFPFTNYHELNLDWILKKVTALFDASEENAQTIRTYETRLTTAEQTATSAATAATAAQQLADAASENADSALSVAGTADSKADSALTAATNAAGAVAGALTTAQEAQQIAVAAVATANDAAATASSLESLANTANQNATAALETAQTADQKAVAAQSAAATADQKAVAAQTAATTNAGNISTLQTDVSNLNRQLSDTKSALVNQGIHFFPEAMKADVAVYETVQPSLITENARYASAGNLVTDATGFCAVKVDVMPYDQLYVNGASVGYDGTYRVYMMSGDTLVSSLGVGAEYTPYFSIPEGVDNVRFTCTLNGYNQNALFIRLLSYASIANKEYAENMRTKSVIPFTDLTITDNYRVGPSGNLIQTNGYYAIEFDVKAGDVIWFFRSLLGYNSTFNIVLMFDNTVKSIITDSGITGQAGKYKLIVPDEVNKIKATGSMANKYPYNILKEQILDDGAISGNNYTNGQTTYIVGNGYFPTIQSACDFADANDIIYIKSGTYNEAVSIWNKKLHLVGENRNTTFIIEHVGNYDNPPLKMNIGSLSNITLIEDGADSASDTASSGKLGAYCLHIEAINPSTEVFEVDNCVFKNAIHAPLGCGLQNHYTVRFRNCVFECAAANEDGASERGAFYVHTAVTSNPTNQHVIAENCIMSSLNNIVVLLGIPSGATGSADYRFSGCTMWSTKRGVSDNAVLFDINSADATFSKVQSYGNTIAILNS